MIIIVHHQQYQPRVELNFFKLDFHRDQSLICRELDYTVFTTKKAL